MNEDYSQFFDAHSQINLNEDDVASLQSNSLYQTQSLDIQNLQVEQQFHSTTKLQEQLLHSELEPQLSSQNSQDQKLTTQNIKEKDQEKQYINIPGKGNQQSHQKSSDASQGGSWQKQSYARFNESKQPGVSKAFQESSVQSSHMKTGSVSYKQKVNNTTQKEKNVEGEDDRKDRVEVSQTLTTSQPQVIAQAIIPAKKPSIFQRLNAGWTNKSSQQQQRNDGEKVQSSEEISRQQSHQKPINQNQLHPQLQAEAQESDNNPITNLKQFESNQNGFDPFDLSEIQGIANDDQSELMISRNLDETYSSPTDNFKQQNLENQYVESQQQIQIRNEEAKSEHSLSPIKINSYFRNQQSPPWKNKDLEVFNHFEVHKQADAPFADLNEMSSILDLNAIQIQSAQDDLENQFFSSETYAPNLEGQTNQAKNQIQEVKQQKAASYLPQTNQERKSDLEEHEQVKLHFDSNQQDKIMVYNQTSATVKPQTQTIATQGKGTEQIQSDGGGSQSNNKSANSNSTWQKVTFAKRRSSNNATAAQQQQIQKLGQPASLTSKILQKQQSLNQPNTKQNMIIEQEASHTNHLLEYAKPTYEMVGTLIGSIPDLKSKKPIKKKKSDDILPVFDCLFCCQEHFVLNKINERSLMLKYATSLKHFIWQRDKLTINWLILRLLPREREGLQPYLQFNFQQTSSSKQLGIKYQQNAGQVQMSLGADKFHSFIGFHELKSVYVKNVSQEFETKVARLLLEIDYLERQDQIEQQQDSQREAQSSIPSSAASKQALKSLLLAKQNKQEEESKDKQVVGDLYKVPQSIKLMFLLPQLKKENNIKQVKVAKLNEEAEEEKKAKESNEDMNFFGGLSGAESMLLDANESNFLLRNRRTRKQKIYLATSFESQVFNIYDPYYSSQDESKSINLQDTESQHFSQELQDDESLSESDEELEESEEFSDSQEEDEKEDSGVSYAESGTHLAEDDEDEVEYGDEDEEQDLDNPSYEESVEPTNKSSFLRGQVGPAGTILHTDPEDEFASDREMLNQLQLVKGISERINSEPDQIIQGDLEQEDDISDIQEIVKVCNQKEDQLRKGKPPQSPNQNLKTQFKPQKARPSHQNIQQKALWPNVQPTQNCESDTSNQKNQFERVQYVRAQKLLQTQNLSQQNICGLSSIDQQIEEEDVALEVDEEEYTEARQGASIIQGRFSQGFSSDMIAGQNQSISQIRQHEDNQFNNDSIQNEDALGVIGIGTGITSISNINQTNDEQLMRKQSAQGNLNIQEYFRLREGNEESKESDLEDEDSERYTFGCITPKDDNHTLSGIMDNNRVTFTHHNGETSLSPVRATATQNFLQGKLDRQAAQFGVNQDRGKLRLVQEEYYEQVLERSIERPRQVPDFNHFYPQQNNPMGSSLSNSEEQTQNPLYLDISPVSCNQRKGGLTYLGEDLTKLHFNQESISQDQHQIISQMNSHQVGAAEEQKRNNLRTRINFYPSGQDQDSLEIEKSNNGLRQKIGEIIQNREEVESITMDQDFRNALPFMRPSQYSYDQQLMLSSSIQFNQDSLENNTYILQPGQQNQMLNNFSYTNGNIQPMNFSNNPSTIHNQMLSAHNPNNISENHPGSNNDMTETSQLQKFQLEDRGTQSRSFTTTGTNLKLNHQRVLPQNQIKLKLKNQQQLQTLKQNQLGSLERKQPLAGSKQGFIATEVQVTPQTIRNAMAFEKSKLASLEIYQDKQQKKDGVGMNSRKQAFQTHKDQSNEAEQNPSNLKPKTKNMRIQGKKSGVVNNPMASFDSVGAESYGPAKQLKSQQSQGYSNNQPSLSKNTASSIEYADDFVMLQIMESLNQKQRKEAGNFKKMNKGKNQTGSAAPNSQKVNHKQKTQAICTPIDTNDAVYFNSNNQGKVVNGNYPFSAKTLMANTTSHQNGRRQNNSNMGVTAESSKLMFLGNTCKNGTSSQTNLLPLADILPLPPNNQLFTNRKYEMQSTKNTIASEKRPSHQRAVETEKLKWQLQNQLKQNSKQVEKNYLQFADNRAVQGGSTSKNASSKTLKQTQSPISLTKNNQRGGFFNNMQTAVAAQSNTNHLAALGSMQNGLNLLQNLQLSKKDFNMYMKSNQILSSRYATTAGTSNLPFSNLFKQPLEFGNAAGLGVAFHELKVSQTHKKKRRSNKFTCNSKASNIAGLLNQAAPQRDGSLHPQHNSGVHNGLAGQHTQSVQSTTNSKGKAQHMFNEFSSTLTSGGTLGTTGQLSSGTGKRLSKGGSSGKPGSKKSGKKDQAKKSTQKQFLQQDYYHQMNDLQQQYQSSMNYNNVCNSMNFSNDYSIPSIMGGMGGISNIHPTQLSQIEPSLSKQQSLSNNNSRHQSQHQQSLQNAHHQANKSTTMSNNAQEQYNQMLYNHNQNQIAMGNQSVAITGSINPQMIMDQSTVNNFFGHSTLIQAEMSTTCISNGNNGTMNQTTSLNPTSKQQTKMQMQQELKQKPQKNNEKVPMNFISDSQSLKNISQTMQSQEAFDNRNNLHSFMLNKQALDSQASIKSNQTLHIQQLKQIQALPLQKQQQQLMTLQAQSSINNQSLNLSSMTQSNNNTNLSNMNITANSKNANKQQLIAEIMLQKQNSSNYREQGFNPAANYPQQLKLVKGPHSNSNKQIAQMSIQQKVNNSVEEISLFNLLQKFTGPSVQMPAKNNGSHNTLNREGNLSQTAGSLQPGRKHQTVDFESSENEVEHQQSVSKEKAQKASKKQPKIKEAAIKKNQQILNKVRHQSNQSVRSNSIGANTLNAGGHMQINSLGQKVKADTLVGAGINSQDASLERLSQAAPILFTNERADGYQLSFVNQNNLVRGPHSSQFSFSQQKHQPDMLATSNQQQLFVDNYQQRASKVAVSEQIIRNQTYIQAAISASQKPQAPTQSSAMSKIQQNAQNQKNSAGSIVATKQTSINKEKRTRSSSKSQSQAQSQTLANPHDNSHSEQPTQQLLLQNQTIAPAQLLQNKKFLMNQQHMLNQLQAPSNSGGLNGNQQPRPLHSLNMSNTILVSKQSSIKSSFIGGVNKSHGHSQIQAAVRQNKNSGTAIGESTSKKSNQSQSTVTHSQELLNQLQGNFNSSTGQQQHLASAGAMSCNQNHLINSYASSSLNENLSLTRTQQQSQKQQAKANGAQAAPLAQVNLKNQTHHNPQKSLFVSTAQNSKNVGPHHQNQGNNMSIGGGTLAFQNELNKMYGTSKILMSQVTSPLRPLMNASVSGAAAGGGVFGNSNQTLSFSHAPSDKRLP